MRRPPTIDQTTTEQFASVTTLAMPKAPAHGTRHRHRKTLSWGGVWKREIHRREFRIYLMVLPLLSIATFLTIMAVNQSAPVRPVHAPLSLPTRPPHHRTVPSKGLSASSGRLPEPPRRHHPITTSPRPHRSSQSSSAPPVHHRPVPPVHTSPAKGSPPPSSPPPSTSSNTPSPSASPTVHSQSPQTPDSPTPSTTQ